MLLQRRVIKPIDRLSSCGGSEWPSFKVPAALAQGIGFIWILCIEMTLVTRMVEAINRGDFEGSLVLHGDAGLGNLSTRNSCCNDINSSRLDRCHFSVHNCSNLWIGWLPFDSLVASCRWTDSSSQSKGATNCQGLGIGVEADALNIVFICNVFKVDKSADSTLVNQTLIIQTRAASPGIIVFNLYIVSIDARDPGNMPVWRCVRCIGIPPGNTT